MQRYAATSHSTPHIVKMGVDYAAPAEMYVCSSRGSSPRAMTYRRFPSVAKAIQFAIEELPSRQLFGTVLEVNEQRFDASQIRSLYDNDEYPFPRRDGDSPAS